MFHAAHPDLAHGTKRNYKRTLRFLELHLGTLKIQAVDETTSAAIDSFRATRQISNSHLDQGTSEPSRLFPLRDEG